MPWVASAAKSGAAGFGTDGAFAWYPANDGASKKLFTLPTDVGYVDEQVSYATYGSRCYVNGGFADNLMIDENLRCLKQGILPPDVVPTVVAGAGTGVTGTIIGYLSFWDDDTQERSPLSDPSASFVVANKDFSWTTIPTSSVDSRVTHVELWRSVNGGSIRFVARRTLGVTSVTENVATLALGEVAPDTHFKFPRCTLNAIYHDRLACAGDPENPDTVYLSALFFPERHEGLSFKTRNGEPIVAIIPTRDVLLVLCSNSSYILQGYLENDYTFNLSDPAIGGINQHLCFAVHGNAWVLNNNSYYMFNGSWHNMMKTGEVEWRKNYEENQTEIERFGYSVYDSNTNLLYANIGSKFTDFSGEFGGIGPLAIGIGSIAYAADLSRAIPEVSGTFMEPGWAFKVRSRTDRCTAILSAPGSPRGDLYTGSSDGFIRKENSATDFTDDGDSYGNRSIFVSMVNFFGIPGGDIEEGKTLNSLWTYVESEFNAWELYVVGGDESMTTFLPLLPTSFQFKETIPASAVVGYAAETVHTHMPTQANGAEISGRAFMIVISGINTKNMHIRGFGGTFGPGPAVRDGAGGE